MSAVSIVEPEGEVAGAGRGGARRNVFLLAAAQAVLGSAGPLSFSVGALAGYQLLGADKSLATVPVTALNIGVVLGVMGMAVALRFLGRKASFMLGALICAIGGGVAALALFQARFWLFSFGLLLVGLSGGFTQKFRFTAADISPGSYKPRAIAWILAGGVISAVAGPQLAIFGKDLLQPVAFTGAFVALVPLGLAGAALLFFLKLPPARAPQGAAEPARPLGEIVATRRFAVGLACGVGSYALMVFMMIGAPLAMFAPSFFTGALIARFGAERVVAAGLLTLMACAVIAHLGVALWNFWTALVLLGLGWNFAFIGATAIVSSSYRPHEADKVQGFHDIVLFGTVALASLLSGKLFTLWGSWSVMNLAIWPVAGLCLLFVLMLLRGRRQDAHAL